VPISFVDLRKRPIAQGELRRFVERLGAEALLDPTSRSYRDAGLGYLRMDEPGIVERLLADPTLLRLPLVRRGSQCTAGRAEATWTGWLRPAGGA
jgi:arsenate reductase-like glutaredoxin family protein